MKERGPPSVKERGPSCLDSLNLPRAQEPRQPASGLVVRMLNRHVLCPLQSGTVGRVPTLHSRMRSAEQENALAEREWVR